MTDRRSWEEFREAGLLWWVNRALHLFGWTICCVVADDGTGQVTDVYPAHCTYRGFTREAEVEGFNKLTGHLVTGVDRMWDDMGKKDDGD